LTTSPDITADLISAAVAEIAEQRAVIDAKGMLTLLYGVDDQAAFDMLRARSQNTNITVRTLAEQLLADYRALVNEEALYEALMSVHERIVATDRT
jgi:ANTAR domain